MANVIILGAGVMGTAMSVPLCDNGHRVQLVGSPLDDDIIEHIENSRIHPKLKTTVPQNVQPYSHDQLDAVVNGADLVLLGVNSLGINWAIETLGPRLPAHVPVLAVTKGLVGDGRNIRILPEVLQSGLSTGFGLDIRIAAIGGPAIAGEVAVRRHTCVVFTGDDRDLLNRLADMLKSPNYHIWIDTDVVGVEVCVALKNAYALAVGMVQGFLEQSDPAENAAAMHNVAAALFAQGLWETTYLVDHLGGNRLSALGLPGAGDLHVTCQGGRNSRMGRLLGLGQAFSQAKAQHMADDTVEGAELAHAIGPTIKALIARGDLEGSALPLLNCIIDIVCHDTPVAILWDRFFSPLTTIP
jgi:glycerol-3-phosphate dehydrogenase (NAD(P)+)